jgi:hypothetical protein
MAHTEDFDDGDYDMSPMFGDPFGNRGDYSKGIFYGGRRRFLHPKRDDNHLQPPEIFMTKGQKKRMVLGEKGKDTIMLRKFDFVDKQEGSSQAQGKKEKGTGKKGRKKKDITFIEKYSSTNKRDWVEEVQAGCLLYVNKSTGEVSDECPWDEETNKLVIPGSPGSLRLTPDRYAPREEPDEPQGTGALFYEDRYPPPSPRTRPLARTPCTL